MKNYLLFDAVIGYGIRVRTLSIIFFLRQRQSRRHDYVVLNIFKLKEH